ncbi:hypothetical protein Hanom_Chr00s000002g01599111 [Helianthus anomalus]
MGPKRLGAPHTLLDKDHNERLSESSATLSLRFHHQLNFADMKNKGYINCVYGIIYML